MSEQRVCEEKDCNKSGDRLLTCTVDYTDDSGDWQTDVFLYCADHAVENGFCCGCGIFCAGIESFDFIHPGLCDNCYDEVKANEYIEHEAEDSFFYPPY